MDSTTTTGTAANTTPTTLSTATTVDNNNMMSQVGSQPFSHPLNETKETLLTRGPNFAVVPKCSPKEKYIATLEEAYLRLPKRAP